MKTLSAVFALVFFSVPLCGQILLSPIWRFYDADQVADSEEGERRTVNLLLSWERQGYSGLDGACMIENDFFVEEGDEGFVLEFSFPGEVSEVQINGRQIVAQVPNSFWSERGKRTLVPIQESLLEFGAKNEIRVFFNYLSYTGGLSHSVCELRTEKLDTVYEASIEIPERDHVFSSSEECRILVNVGNGSDGLLRVSIANDFHETVYEATEELEERTDEQAFNLGSLELEPGFYECVVVREGGRTFSGAVEWFAIEPEAIECSTLKPLGFDAYWKDALEELAMVPAEFKMSKDEALCSSKRDGYLVEMESLGGVTVRGYYFVPRSEGPHLAMLHLPGYGYGFEDVSGFVESDREVVELVLCVRGHGISKVDFDPWDTMTLWASGICDAEKYVYRSMYMDCVRAVEFLQSRPEVDRKRIGVLGGSQGGGLALATAGLCGDDIAGCAVFDPWMCDFRHQAAIRTLVVKELESFRKLPENSCEVEQMLSVLDFVDTKFFAGDIQCPVYFSTALFDDDCPPHCGFSIFNALATEKEFLVHPTDSHLGESGQYQQLAEKLERMLR